ncbi:MAG: lactate racemase domain-containing protein [Myxococcota bacterium]|nr:lactate racemase domain-containing protein [Myxococcota bacterium]
MTRGQFELTYGKETRSFTIPWDRVNGSLIAPREPTPLPGNARTIIEQALAAPVDRSRLREMAGGKRVGIVISDAFRAGLQRDILDGLLDEVAAGNPASVTVISATGTHNPDVYAKSTGEWVAAARTRLGMDIEFEPHHSENSAFADLGTTSRGTVLKCNAQWMRCDLRVYGHESKHHYLNGYSSIDKQIVPGVSSGQTVAMNHKWALHPDSGPGRNPWHGDVQRRSNPFAEDGREARAMSEQFVLNEAGDLVKAEIQTFGLDMVSAGQNVYWIKTGDPDQICREMVAVVDRLMEIQVTPSKYVIVSPGGPPASQALYGTQNCFDLALKGAVLPGGEALVIAPLDGRPDLPPDVSGIAPDARSKALFWDNLVRLLPQPLEAARAEISDNFELYLWKTDRVLRLIKGQKVQIHLFSQAPEKRLEPGGFYAAPDIQSWIDARVARNDGLFTVINDGNKLCITEAQ